MPGLFSHTSRTELSGPRADVASAATEVAPAILAPTSYVGYATWGWTTVSPAPRPSSVGSQATSSLDPMAGITPSPGSGPVPRTRWNHAATASCTSGVPATVG